MITRVIVGLVGSRAFVTSYAADYCLGTLECPSHFSGDLATRLLGGDDVDVNVKLANDQNAYTVFELIKDQSK